MGWLSLKREPELEVMEGAEEVEAYASAAAQAYLDSLDNSWVERVLLYAPPTGLLLDIGTGPGGIPLKIARRCPGLRLYGVDHSAAMIGAARRAAADPANAGLAERVCFLRSDAHQLCFHNASFDVVISNSLLHHLDNPLEPLNEMARVARPGAVVLLRDLQRPSRLAYPLHVRWYGRYYSGLMRKLYEDSVRAAYTCKELTALLGRLNLRAEVFREGRTHLGFIRGGPTVRDGRA